MQTFSRRACDRRARPLGAGSVCVRRRPVIHIARAPSPSPFARRPTRPARRARLRRAPDRRLGRDRLHRGARSDHPDRRRSRAPSRWHRPRPRRAGSTPAPRHARRDHPRRAPGAPRRRPTDLQPVGLPLAASQGPAHPGLRPHRAYASRIVDGKPFHDGIDLATFCGDRIVAAHDGVVLAASRHFDHAIGWLGDLTRYYKRLDAKKLWKTLPIVVVIDDGNGYRSMYAHFEKVVVKRGQRRPRRRLPGLRGPHRQRVRLPPALRPVQPVRARGDPDRACGRQADEAAARRDPPGRSAAGPPAAPEADRTRTARAPDPAASPSPGCSRSIDSRCRRRHWSAGATSWNGLSWCCGHTGC